jgi:thioredoxin 1
LDFSAPWYIPCRALEPVIRRVEEEDRGRVEVKRIDVNENPEIAKVLGVYGIPTLVAVHDGKEVVRRTGFFSKTALNGLFDAALTGIQPVSSGPAPRSRLLRLATGIFLLYAGFLLFPSTGAFLLACLGAVALFTAVDDRCPIYRMVSARIKDLFRRRSSYQNGSNADDPTGPLNLFSPNRQRSASADEDISQPPWRLPRLPRR